MLGGVAVLTLDEKTTVAVDSVEVIQEVGVFPAPPPVRRYNTLLVVDPSYIVIISLPYSSNDENTKVIGPIV